MTDFIDPSGPAVGNMQLVKSVAKLMNVPDDTQARLFAKALKRFELTERELVDGFWKAYADHMIPSSGIEFRHIFKHVSAKRKEDSEAFFTSGLSHLYK